MRGSDVASRLHDILDALRHLESFGGGQSFQRYVGDAQLRLASERCIEIISEASRHIPDDLKSRHPTVPWRQVAGIGNVLRHGYKTVDDRIVWRVITQDLPPLKAAVEAMLREVEGQGA